MGYHYWDSGTEGSTSNRLGEWYSWGDTTSASNSMWYVVCPRPRTILVRHPEHWTDDDAMAFVKLVNVETKTGWLVTMVIKGDVIITDPDIETRTMEEFVPLLRWRASRDDNAKIDMFFDGHPLVEDISEE